MKVHIIAETPQKPGCSHRDHSTNFLRPNPVPLFFSPRFFDASHSLTHILPHTVYTHTYIGSHTHTDDHRNKITIQKNIK